MSRDFITISQLSDEDLDHIYDAAVLPVAGDELSGVAVSLVFEFPSLRTRASSLSAIQRLGGMVAMFTGDEVGIDTRESAEDVARTLSATSDIVALRVRDQEIFERMVAATSSELRLINLLSNHAHPTQAVADVLTLADHHADGNVHGLDGLVVSYVGDATNVTRSLASALVRLGVKVVVGAPDGYQLSKIDLSDINAKALGSGQLVLTNDPVEAVSGANAVYTDSWISMGLESESAKRRRDLSGFQVNHELLAHAATGALVMHCLPAHRGEEITDEVLDSQVSVVWDQVQHRTSAMLGVLRWMKGSLL